MLTSLEICWGRRRASAVVVDVRVNFCGAEFDAMICMISFVLRY